MISRAMLVSVGSSPVGQVGEAERERAGVVLGHVGEEADVDGVERRVGRAADQPARRRRTRTRRRR